MQYRAHHNNSLIDIYNDDCMRTVKLIPDNSIDLMLTDPPYNVLSCDWDKRIDLDELWVEWERIVKPNGAFIFTATQPFASLLIQSRINLFKYDLIWIKNRIGNFLNAKIQPLRNHESILIFYRKQPTYNPIMRKVLYNCTSKYHNQAKTTKAFNINPDSVATKNRIHNKKAGDDGYPLSVLDFGTDKSGFDSSKPNQNRHPTQKPLDLFRYLILTYSNEGDTVFDGYSGSGTTAEACIVTCRNFIGSELERKYYDQSISRIKNVTQQLF